MTTNENDKSIFIPRKRLLVLIRNTVLEQEKKRANYSGKTDIILFHLQDYLQDYLQNKNNGIVIK